MAGAWNGKSEYDRAIEDFTESIRLQPDYAGAYRGRGFAWHGKGEYDQALKDNTEVIRLQPDDAGGYCGRGNAWLSKNNYLARCRLRSSHPLSAG